MVYSPLRPPPTQDPVAQDDFDAFGFALHAAVQLIKILEYLHGRASGPLVLRPLVSLCLPLIECHRPLGIAAEPHTNNATGRGLVSGFEHGHVLERILPTTFKPRLAQYSRNRVIGESPPGDLHY